MTNAQTPAPTLDFESTLWAAAEKLRGSMDAAEYKHVVLGLIFLKYISDAFQERYDELVRITSDPSHEYYLKDKAMRQTVIEDRDEYLAERVFWVPEKARWTYLQAHAKNPEIGVLIDEAMHIIEKDNPARLKNVLPKDYARPALDKSRLGELIDLISTIALGDAQSRNQDILGRVYEYFLARFAAAEGKLSGQFYTPISIVKLLAEMMEPYEGRIFDPCCGSGGMFVQAGKFVESHGGNFENGAQGKLPSGAFEKIAIYGQESNYTTWRLAQMNLAIRGISAKIEHGDSLLNDQFPDLKADFIMANPPFNMEDWGYSKVQNDARWRRFDNQSNAVFPLPAGGERKQKNGSVIHADGGNANYAWILHFLSHLSPNGTAGFVIANGALSTATKEEFEIRKALIEHDLVDCIVALPSQLFYTTQIPACLWFLTRDKGENPQKGHRDRSGSTLFIDARKRGTMIDRRQRDLTEEDIASIADAYHNWRNSDPKDTYEDVAGFCMSASLKDIQKHGYVLTPGRYVGAEDDEDDGIPFEEKMAELSAQLFQQMREAEALDETIRRNLETLGFAE